MRNVLVLTAVGSVLALGSTTIVAKPVSLEGLVHKVQSGGDKAPGARGQDGGKSTAPGGRDGGGGQGKEGMGQGKGKDMGGERGAGPEKGAGADKADRGTQTRSGEKGSRDKQRATERGGRTGVDVDVRGGRGYRSDGRTRIDIDEDRRRRSGGRDVDVNIRGGQGYRPSKGGVDCEQIVRRYSMCFRR
jgi:hypothetical protein